MAMGKLANIKVAAIMTDGFEQIELVSPRNVLENEGRQKILRKAEKFKDGII